MSPAKLPQVLLTLDDVLSWKRERDAAAARIIELDRKLLQVMPLVPEEARIEIFGTADLPETGKARDEKAVVSRYLREILQKQNRYMAIAEIEGIAAHGDVGDIVKNNPGMVAELISGLARHGRIKKRGETYAHPSAEEELAKSYGPLASRSNGTYGEADYFREMILARVVKAPEGMAVSDVIALFKGDPKGKRKIEGNPQYPYSLLGRMVAKEQLTKHQGRFFHPTHQAAERTEAGAENKTVATSDEEATASESPAGLIHLSVAAQAA